MAQFRSHKKAKPQDSLSLKAFDPGLPIYLHMILDKNSPLTPVMRHGVMVLRQTGILQHVDRKWFGGDAIEGKPARGKGGLTVLSSGQVIIIFFIMISCVAGAVLLLAMEVFYQKSVTSSGGFNWKWLEKLTDSY